MRLLLTGAGGFIGRALLHRLAGHELFALVRPGAALSGCTVIPCDLAAPLDRTYLPDRIDGVIHLAQSHLWRAFPERADDVFAINVASTAALADWARSAHASRFCLVSTGSVYEPYQIPLREDAALAPTSYYSASKLAAELLLRPYGPIFAATCLRLFFPYGPGQQARLIPDLIARVRSGTPITLPENGPGMVIAPTFVDDVAEIIATACEQGWTGPLNVASPVSASLQEIGDLIGKLVGKQPSFERSAKAGSLRIVPELEHLAARWDMASFTPLAEGLSRTIAG
jgi:nucleoside-diphosphate-sugar epimerase